MDKTFGVIGEGQPDYAIISNIVWGVGNDKTISVRQLFPEQGKSGGHGRVRAFIGKEEFRTLINNLDYCIIQIDTNECDGWGVKDISPVDGTATPDQIIRFVEKIKAHLVTKIGTHYDSLKDKIIFAITVHELECWLLPFNSIKSSDHARILGCEKTMNKIANEMGYPIGKGLDTPQRVKNFQTLSKDMRKHKELLEKSELNPSLKIFVDALRAKFPPQSATPDVPQS